MRFDKLSYYPLRIANGMVMVPLTGSRATSRHTPHTLIATYNGRARWPV
jgi:hypothetical protein